VIVISVPNEDVQTPPPVTKDAVAPHPPTVTTDAVAPSPKNYAPPPVTTDAVAPHPVTQDAIPPRIPTQINGFFFFSLKSSCHSEFI
jgi:hypothetical protein